MLNAKPHYVHLLRSSRPFGAVHKRRNLKIDWQMFTSNLPLSSFFIILDYRGVFRTFELRVLTVIDCPKISGAKGR